MFRAVEQLEPVIVAVVQKSIEFALCYLEKSIFNRDDLSLQVCIFFCFLFSCLGSIALATVVTLSVHSYFSSLVSLCASCLDWLDKGKCSRKPTDFI